MSLAYKQSLPMIALLANVGAWCLTIPAKMRTFRHDLNHRALTTLLLLGGLTITMTTQAQTATPVPALVEANTTAVVAAVEPKKPPTPQDQSVLRPGDSLFLSLPGESTLNITVQLQRNGNLLLPEIGEVNIQGLTLPQADSKIRALLADVIRDLTGFELVLKQRRLIISVLGYVKKPGTVDLAQDATIQEAISAADGLLPGAQLDKLQVRREQQIFEFNYKHYLDTGDPSKLPELQPLDTIFIPASPLMGNVQVEFDATTLMSSGDAGDSDKAIKIFGEVVKPGSYSYSKDNTIVDLLMRAGGVTRFANVEKIRVLANDAPILFNLKKYLDLGDKNALVTIPPGATIFIPNEADEASSGPRAVYLMGEVNKPGRYDWFEDMTLFDLMTRAGGPNDKANTGRVKILSQDDNGQVVSTLFNMAQFIDQGGSLSDIPTLKPRDTIVIPTLAVDATDAKTKWVRQASEDSIYVMGEVSAPGRYLFNENLHFLDILAAAEGPNDKADVANIRITHRDGAQTRISRFDLGLYFETGDDSTLPNVKPGDVIYIPSHEQSYRHETAAQTVRVLGAVNKQGRYRLTPTGTLLDLLAQAGGLATTAAPAHIVVVNASCCGEANTVTNFDLLAFTKQGDWSQLPPVQAGDTVYVLHREDSTWNRVVGSIQETLSVFSILRILGAI